MRRAALASGVALVVGASAAAFHPTASIALVLSLVVLVWVFSSALNPTLAFIVLLVLRPTDLFPALSVIQPVKLVGLLAILTWLVSKLLRGDLHVSRAPHGKWMLGLFVGVLLSSAFSSNRAASMQLLTDVFSKLLVMYVLIAQLVDTKPRAVKLHLTLALCTAGLAVYALVLRMTGLAEIEGNRASFVGLLGDPNDLALVLLMYIPLFAELVMESRGGRRMAWLIPLAILVLGVFVTVSRGGVLGLMFALGISVYDRCSVRLRLTLMPILAAVMLGLLLLAGVNQRSSGTINQGELDASSQGRLDAWESGARMTLHHPLLGVGFGQFAVNYMSYARDPTHWGPIETHNSFIKVAAETGLLGFIPFMALVLLTFRSAYELRKADLPDDSLMERAVRRSLFPAMTGFCVAAFFLSQCWGWFLFIMFAQSAAIHEIWKPDLERSKRSVPVQDRQNGTARLSIQG